MLNKSLLYKYEAYILYTLFQSLKGVFEKSATLNAEKYFCENRDPFLSTISHQMKYYWNNTHE